MTTLLMMTLMLGTADVGLSSESAARLLVGADAPVQAMPVSRLQLLDERAQLIAERPTVTGPVMMLGGSTLLGGGAALLWLAFIGLGGIGSGWEMIITVPVLVLAVLASGGSIALGAIGSWMLAKRIGDIAANDAKIGAIDEQLRTGWPQGQRPAALQR